MLQLRLIERSGLGGSLKAYDVLDAIELTDDTSRTREEPAAFMRIQFPCMGDQIVENVLGDAEIGHDLDGAADRVVSAQIFDFRFRTAQGAVGIFGTADLPEFHLKGVVDEQLIGDRFADTEYFFDCF